VSVAVGHALGQRPPTVANLILMRSATYSHSGAAIGMLTSYRHTIVCAAIP
jgi:hypothetical protein